MTEPTTARAEAVRAWACDLLMRRPPGLALTVSLAVVGVSISGDATQPHVTTSGQTTSDFHGALEPDDLAAGAGLLLGAALALQALSERAEAMRELSIPTYLKD